MSAALRQDLDDARRGLAEWRALALAAQAQVKHQAGMRSELALFFRDLRNHLLHVIDMSKGEHYLDVVRLNAQALIQRMELLAAAQVTGDRTLAHGCHTPEKCCENGCLGWCDEHRPEAGPDSKTPNAKLNGGPPGPSV